MIDLRPMSDAAGAEPGEMIRALADVGVAGITVAGADAAHVLDGRTDARMFIEVRVGAEYRRDARTPVRHDEAVRRATSYVAAGADGVLLPGGDIPLVVRVTREVAAPVSVELVDGWAPPVHGLARIGVRGVRLGGNPIRAARGLMGAVAAEVVRRGTYDLLSRTLDYTRKDQ